jgi:hypothetical protein
LRSYLKFRMPELDEKCLPCGRMKLVATALTS